MSFKKRLLSYLKAAPSMPWLTEVECLQNDYFQTNNSAPHIDTEVKANWDLPFELVATVTKTSANRCLILGNAPNQRTFYIELTATNRLRFSSQDSTGTDPTFVEFNIYTSSSYPIPLNVPTKIWVKYNPLNDAAHTIKYEMGLEALDGSVSTTQTGSVYRSGEPLSTRLNLRMFTDYRTPVSTFDGGFKIHQCEIKMGTVHKKFIPCLDLNRIPCMYEQVDGKLYYNSGTGGFNVGRRIVEVEYMKLTGYQRFNTGFMANTLKHTMRTHFTYESETAAMMMGTRLRAAYPESCSFYIPTPNSSFPYSRMREDWAADTGTAAYSANFTSNDHTAELTCGYAKVDGVVTTNTATSDYTMSKPWYFGCVYTINTNTFQYYQVGKIYFVELLDTYTREQYRYCVPAHDENNIGFFFDRVNHFVIENEGSNTQDMTWGDEIHPVGFLYGGAPDRFNTGITFYGHKWETDARFNQSRNDINLMGVASGACNYWGVLSNGSAALYGQYSLHTSNAEFGLNIDPTETRTVFLDSYRNNANTYDMLSMTVEGQSVTRSTSEANRTTGYRVPDFSTSYPEPAYLYGNRCYDRTTNNVLQNGIVVQNGQKQPILFDTITHSIIDTITSGVTTKLGSDVIGYRIDSQLPYGFVEVDYLESTGTQYLNTGITPTNTMGIDVTYAYPTISGSTNAGVCGTYQGTSPRTDAFFVSSRTGTTDSNILLAQGGVAKNTAVLITENTWVNAKINWLSDGLLLLDNGVSSTAIGTNTIESNKLILFGRVKASDSSIACAVARIRSFRMSDGLRITHDYVPCLRTYDNKPGMFDLITRQFLTNQGTGEFIIGIDGVGYTPADYLESTGTQWIDTGIKMQGKYGVEIEAKQTSADTGFGRYLFGDAPASAGRYLIVVTSGGNIFRLGLDTLNRDSNVSGYDGKYHVHKVENKTYFIDGVSQGTLNTPDFTCNRNARLFSVATTSTLTDNTWQIKRCIIKDANNNKLANFVPLVRASDSKPGMFDLVSRTLCVNGAEGADFTVGAR